MTERQFDAKMKGPPGQSHKALISEYIAWMPESYLDELMQAIEQRRDAIQRRVMTPIEIPAWPKQAQKHNQFDGLGPLGSIVNGKKITALR